MANVRGALTGLLLLLLSGCGTLPSSPEPSVAVTPWESRVKTLSQLQQWQLEGRVALRMGKEGGQSSFRWVQSPQQQQFELSGLLGAGALQLTSSEQGAVLEQGGERYQGRHASTLLASVSGWKIPVEAARYWVRGIPHPQQPITYSLLDEANRLQQLEQAGWKIEVRRYQTVGEIQLPAFVVLSQNEVKLKMKLNQWVLPQ